ncbi:GNAT family N-acetyltransferase [Marimonas lutisalis]|uniref:GNAT family N-acetyltransferase n=1 Tax=Marimonas lutisalis TaxID=2545756 RepID=UPI0010F52086|nr:GNAT family N-acetyltransferase [Marimonas lutisalis]
MTPRRARLWHLPAIARILWRETGWPAARRADLALLARLIRRGQVRVVAGPAGPRGFIIRDGALVHALYTHPRARRQGIGSRLLAEAQEAAHRLELWTGQDNGAARAFYARHGFYPAMLSNGEGNDDGVPDVQMIWERNAP